MRRLASVHPEASTILLQSKGKTPSNSMCSAFNKDVQKGVDVTVDGVHGVCRLGKHFLRCVPALWLVKGVEKFISQPRANF